MIAFLRNRAKPIKGLIASAITYVALKLGLELEPEAAATLSGLVFALVVERVKPVFGVDVNSPVVGSDGGVVRRR